MLIEILMNGCQASVTALRIMAFTLILRKSIVMSMALRLNILNSLIGSRNIKDDFKALIKKYPEVFKCIPLLLAVRANEIYCQDENGGHLYQFNFGKIWLRVSSKKRDLLMGQLVSRKCTYIRFPLSGALTSLLSPIKGGGSKLNETARSYKTLATETDTICSN